ncbi:hypothetical protein [Pantanalinema sp. GBBB05]|uniref:hypothetical protein n=1 Tax=Pantanalinema sp. GBBB05 TaxID=2604139 RepID=UPI001D342933|nr:hypothetical protein [Pantanalinema sp. GBBB05]
MNDAAFTIFIAFGVIWAIIGGAALIALLKADGQQIRLGKWGLVVAIPTLLPLVIALIFAAIYHP